MTATLQESARLARLRVGARAILALGIGASLAANVLAAEPSGVGRIIAAWSPVALFLNVELISRVPAVGGWLSTIRIAATASIAGIAAWVSYWHMVEVAVAHGEAPVAAHLLPISVDGLVIVASVCMKEISTRLQPSESTLSAPAADPLSVSSTRSGVKGDRPVASAGEPETAAMKPKPERRSSVAGKPVGDQVRRLANDHPDWSQARIAEAVGCSDRTVRRHLADTSDETASDSTEVAA